MIQASLTIYESFYRESFYREIIVPFLHEIQVGKSKIATELTNILSSPPPKTVKLIEKETFECELLHQHHRENFHEFFCLTNYVDCIFFYCIACTCYSYTMVLGILAVNPPSPRAQPRGQGDLRCHKSQVTMV